MTKAELAALIDDLRAILDKLYEVSLDDLKGDQMSEHQLQLNKTYIALIRAENAQLKAINDSAKANKLPALTASINKMKSDLDGITAVVEILKIVDQGLKALTSLGTLLKPA